LNRDEKAIDTLFGGITFILICVICSINLLILSIAWDESDENPSTNDNVLDYLLGSEICVSKEFEINMILYDYILCINQNEEYRIEDIIDDNSSIREEICNLIEFYFPSMKYWILSASISSEEMIIASSAKTMPENFESIIQYRLIGGESGITDISLTLYR